MQKRMVLSIVLSLIALLTLSTSVAAKRKKRAKKPASLSSLPIQHIALELGTVPLGKDRSATLSYLTAILEARYQQKMRATLDAELRDQYQRQKLAALKKLKESFTEFKGNTTGYEVTSIAKDFKHHTGESLYRFDDGRIQKYYFMIKQRFWKVVWSFNDDKSYAATLARLRKALGSPASATATVRTWRGRNHIVTLRDERKLYGSYTVVVAHRATLELIGQLRKGGASHVGTNPNVSDTVKKLSNQKKRPEVDNVVDRITGKKQKIDLNLGKKKNVPQLDKEKED